MLDQPGDEMTFSPETLRELSLPLNPDRVSVLNDGPAKGAPYLDGEDVTRRANEIFGFGNWGFELASLPTLVESEGNSQVWAALGRLHVRDAMPIADLGTCVRHGPGSHGLEMAIKGCATDAMKRCLKQLGDQFGLVLYDKSVNSDILRREWEAATKQPSAPSAPRDLEAESYAVVFNAFVRECKAGGVGARLICEALGFEAESAEMAKHFMETEGPDALRAWEEANEKGWNHLSARLIERRRSELEAAAR